MRLKRYLSEANDSPVGIFVGRMSPPTKAHQKIIADAIRKYGEVYVIIIEGAKSSQDPKNFLSYEQRREILKITNPGAVLIKSDYGFIPYIIKVNKIDTSNGVAIIAGPDRIKNYQTQFKKETYTVTYDEPPRMMAATDLRKAMAENDFETYKKMAADGIDNEKWYKKLRASFKAKGNEITE
jgi:cytidyltransferase-like protein